MVIFKNSLFQKNQNNLSTILYWIVSCWNQNMEIYKSKLIKVIMEEFNCSRTKAREYLDTLEQRKKIKMVDDKIFYIGFDEKDYIALEELNSKIKIKKEVQTSLKTKNIDNGH